MQNEQGRVVVEHKRVKFLKRHTTNWRKPSLRLPCWENTKLSQQSSQIGKLGESGGETTLLVWAGPCSIGH